MPDSIIGPLLIYDGLPQGGGHRQALDDLSFLIGNLNNLGISRAEEMFLSLKHH